MGPPLLRVLSLERWELSQIKIFKPPRQALPSKQYKLRKENMLQIPTHIHSEKIQNPGKKDELQSSATENHPLQGDAERRTKGEKRRALQYDHALGRSHTFCCGRAEPVRSQQGWFGNTPQKGKYRATSGTVLGRLGLTRSCPYCASV